ncbi:MAG TPA: YbhB/YbcL family Raf kinase inhibitor-like protein [Terracidiphilus sp.]|nr:YbhB/YbcL family Raf kinase inhibitor-like protein [Terracidiphilus sp.]
MPTSFAANSAVPARARLALPRRASRKPLRKSAFFAAAFLAAAFVALAACHGAATASGPAMQLTSASFSNGQIPPAFTCDGQNRSPQLAWSKPPYGTRFLALTLVDPDAPFGTFTHWVLFNLPATTRGLPAGLETSSQLPGGALQGENSFHRTGYGGPCPPPGSTHRYIFTLYALDTPLALAPGASRAQLEAALAGHILAHAQLTARYGR